MIDISRRFAVLGLAVGALGPLSAAAGPADLSPEDQRDIAQAIKYIEGLASEQSRFVQTDARGGRSEGTFYLQRPGKARFDYDPPSGLSIASDGHEVRVVDRRLKTIHAYPLGLTPLALFLARDVRLDRGVAVAQVTHTADGLTIVAEDAHKKTQGRIALTFSDAPFSLAGWTITDARGSAVTVRLAGLARAEPRDASFFKLADPSARPRTEAAP